ncbi:F-box/kelch-repeat protein At3g06240, partial [Linum perenne]
IEVKPESLRESNGGLSSRRSGGGHCSQIASQGNTQIQEFDSPFEPVIGEYAALRIVGCCNGVVCFTDNLSSVHRASLWNPCIRKLVEIPPPIAFPKRLTSCLDAVGFGFDALNDDYKLVRVSTHLRRQFVEVYSLRSGVWRMVDHELDCSIRCHSSSVHMNGVCYWVANGRRPCYSNMVVSFALATEVFDEMPPLPDELVKGYNKNMALAASNKGLLSLMSVENVCAGERLLDRATIWVMENDCWVKVMVWESPYSVCKLLAFKDNGVVLFAATASSFHTDEYLVRYDPNTRESVKLMVVRKLGRLHLNANYVESLSLL